jgi:uncharacterized protein (TIGR02246 family)
LPPLFPVPDRRAKPGRPAGRAARFSNRCRPPGKAAIEKVITAYRDALKEANAGKVVALYPKDAVLMPPGAPTALGQEQVKATYEYVFKAIKLDINFTIDDISVNGNNAVVRSTSKGTALVNANGQSAPEENRELFVFQKVGGQWKIARYMYNKTK